MTRCACAVLAIIAACGKGRDTTAPAGPPPTGPTAPAGSAGAAAPAGAGGGGAAAPAGGSAAAPARRGFSCEPLPFAETTPVPEASGAAWLTIDGKRELVVVGDSGNDGAYGIVDPDTGATIETGALPLSDEASDDVEGVAARGDRVYGITSSGWIRVWRRAAGSKTGFELIDKPYPLGPIDLPETKNNDRAPKGDGMVCNGRVVNCGRNYEGLCLAPAAASGSAPASDRCIGFAASKADGHLYCLTETAGKLAVHHDRAIAIGRPGTVADCAFSDDGTLWVGSNMFDLGRVYRVTQWDDPAAAQVERVGALAIGFPETIAARGDIIYRMSDMGGAPSMMVKFRCRRD